MSLSVFLVGTGLSHTSALPGWADRKSFVSVPRTELWALKNQNALSRGDMTHSI